MSLADPGPTFAEARHPSSGRFSSGKRRSHASISNVSRGGCAPRASGKAYVQTKTPDGQPDLQGYWTVSTYIPFERPKNVTKEFYTPAEMAKIEKDEAAVEDMHALGHAREQR